MSNHLINLCTSFVSFDTRDLSKKLLVKKIEFFKEVSFNIVIQGTCHWGAQCHFRNVKKFLLTKDIKKI